MEQWAPLSYAEEWDNPGLQVGDRQKEIHKVLVALTPDEAAAEEAVRTAAQALARVE